MTTAKDEELLGLLRLNGREPVASLARKLGLSRTTVQDRLRRLEANGTIAGYMVKLGQEARMAGIGGLITLAVEPKQQLEVVKRIAKYPEVEMLYAVSGKIDFVALVKTATADDMDALIDRFSMISGVTEIETAVILSTKVDRR